MSDVNKVRSNAGVSYGFEDAVARQRAEEAVEIANEANATSKALSIEVKNAMDTLFRNMVLNDYDGQSEYEIIHSWATKITVVSLSAVYTQSGTVYDTDTLDSLKNDLRVIAILDNSTTADISTYTLSGTLTPGTSSITVSYQGKTTTFDVTVTSYPCLYYWDFTRSLTDIKQGAVASITNCNRTSNGVTIDGTSSQGTANNQYIDLGDVFGLGKTIDIRLKDVSADFGNTVGVMFETWDGENDPGQYNSFGWRYHSTANYLGWGYMTKTNAAWRYPSNDSSSVKKNKQLFDGDHTLTIKITSEGEVYVYKDGVDMDIQYAANSTTPSERPQFDANTEAHSHVPIIGSKLYYPNFYSMTVISAMIYNTEG